VAHTTHLEGRNEVENWNGARAQWKLRRGLPCEDENGEGGKLNRKVLGWNGAQRNKAEALLNSALVTLSIISTRVEGMLTL
jgi:hypothetical protein